MSIFMSENLRKCMQNYIYICVCMCTLNLHTQFSHIYMRKQQERHELKIHIPNKAVTLEMMETGDLFKSEVQGQESLVWCG